MKKCLLVLLVSAFCAACAGNPPQWWNPSGSYGNTPAPVPPKTVTAEPASSSFEEQPIPAEVPIAAAAQDDQYEEMMLTPLQDEETEEASDKKNDGATMAITPSSGGTASEDALPPPSVLE